MTKHSNHLINESSPYLLQHAYNPVNWYPWGEEALGLAKKEDKPILVSIGYSACHWCHVMERESFEDEETAHIMNDLFINIKIDREERPDLDHIYMDAVQAIAGNGGWPLNVFLTPGRKPFYGGTYFPPIRAFNRPSWKEVLVGVSNLFNEKRDEVEEQAETLTQHLGSTNVIAQTNLFARDGAETNFDRTKADTVFQSIMNQADQVWGGFGNAPKFPQTFIINFLLRYHYYTGNAQALEQALLSLDKMMWGGIYDHLGGGFARYSTDREWLAPHFEKMLYDNALLIGSLCDAYQLTGNPGYQKTVDQTIRFIQREMMDTSGGFYSALDADSEGVEGKFYTWTYEEVNHILAEDAPLYCSYYDISETGNWEHTNILRKLKSLDEFAAEQRIDKNDLERKLDSCSVRLLEDRDKRIRPALDDKVLLAWNAMMVIALCKASSAFSNPEYKSLAIRNMEFLFHSFRVDDNTFEFHHTWKHGKAKYPAFLDDYALLISACTVLQEITSDKKYLEWAEGLVSYVINNYQSENGFFYYTAEAQKDVIVRKIELYDGAVPSGNSMMASNLYYMGKILNKPDWINSALQMLMNMEETVLKFPSSFGNWASQMMDIRVGINEIVVIGKGFEELRDEMLKEFIPNRVFQSAEISDDTFPLLAGKTTDESALIYVCRNYSCQLPSGTKTQVTQQIVKKI